MKLREKVKNDLDRKFQKVLATPASFDFFIAIHDFIEYIETNASLSKNLLNPAKASPELRIPIKYGHLKQIYQGLEDADTDSKVDLGHTRCMVLVELNQIRNNNFSESNSFWKKNRGFFKNTKAEENTK